MSREKYRTLIDQLCNRCKFEATEIEYSSCQVQVNNIPFEITPGQEEDPDSFYLICEFGEVPMERRVEVLERLLEGNLVLFGNSAPAHGYDSETGCALVMLRMQLPGMTVDVLYTMMERFSIQAHVWRRNYFLSSTETQQAA